MKFLFLLIFACCGLSLYGQDETRLAENYLDQGEFGKALKIYKTIYKTNERNVNMLYKLIDIHHQMKSYDTVDSLLTNAEKLMPQGQPFMIERGYNQVLQNKEDLAQPYYNEALNLVDSVPGYAYQIATRFEQRSELDEAILAYEKGMTANPNANFNYQLARLYGEQGNLEKMFETYVSLIEGMPNYRAQAQAIFSQYITDDSQSEGNQLLRKVLLLRLRQNPDPLYNQLLSWLFVQQKDFQKAFVQERAIYVRSKENMGALQDLAYTAVEEKDIDAANEVLDYIITESQVTDVRYFADSMKAKLKTDQSTSARFPEITKLYENLLTRYGRDGNTFSMQLDYANYLAFNAGDPETATALLTALETQRLSIFQKADVKTLLADILVLQEQFNRALILYSQVQTDLPNDLRAQESQFKVARTSYYQNDFNWSFTQLKVLRSATSKLIANDAMELSLLIADHSLVDTTFVALKAFAKAELKQYQGKRDEAITLYKQLLLDHKGDDIEDEALLNLAKLYELEGNVEKAREQYQLLIDNYANGILADDAFYNLGLLYEHVLNNPTAAQGLYERIIYEHADSIHFVDARRRFRRLRGDTNLNDF
jgi:tetratricopeptide (TPR) repeat protein